MAMRQPAEGPSRRDVKIAGLNRIARHVTSVACMVSKDRYGMD